MSSVTSGYQHTLRPERSAIPAEVQQEARDFLRAEVAAALLAVDGEQGFVVLHLGFRPIQADQSHKGTYCVWEMGAVQHERQAWIRYLNSARDAAASAAYLADQPDSLLV